MSDAQPEYPGIPYHIPEFRLNKYATLVHELVTDLIIDNKDIPDESLLDTDMFLPIAAKLIYYIDHDETCNGSSCRREGRLAE